MKPEEHDENSVRDIHHLSRRSFLWAGVAGAAGVAAWRWLLSQPKPDGLPWPLASGLRFNESLSATFLPPVRLAPEYSPERAGARVNGLVGLRTPVDPSTFRLRVEGLPATPASRVLSVADVQRMPMVEMVTELMCVEGWSQITRWTGVRVATLIASLLGLPDATVRAPEALVKALPTYAYLACPDDAYYVGLDLPSLLHPQTLLAYRINGEPLPPEHGAPLRLISTVKYGYKSIKRVGLIRFVSHRPADYWAQRGYDWYAGL